jgi:alkylated DNA repair dioxygenase AlkB
MEIIECKLGEGTLVYIPNWADDPDALYRAAKKLSFTPESVTMHGKTSIIERETVDYGLEYGYNLTAKRSIEWEPLALKIKQQLEAQFGRIFAQCACNRYASPTSYIGAHCDKSTPIDGVKVAPNLIVSISLGSKRKMVLRPIRPGHEGKGSNTLKTMNEVRKEKDSKILELEPGSLVMFNGVLNHTWKHAIPMAENKEVAGERISLTFREF